MAATNESNFLRSRLPILAGAALVITLLVNPVLAYGPSTSYEFIWNVGLVLFAVVLYATLGPSPDHLWSLDPSIGPFLLSGLPCLSIPIMQRVNWVANACHFVSRIPTAYGVSNFWIPAEHLSRTAKEEALKIALSVLSPVLTMPSKEPVDESVWKVTSAGLLVPSTFIPVEANDSKNVPAPSAHDFLLFAATDYHAFREWDVRILQKGRCIFSTRGMGHSTAFDVASPADALPIVAAQMVRRPHSQSVLRSLARREGDDEYGPYYLQLDNLDLDAPICNIDFHSYAAETSKIRASLHELAEAYFRVVTYIKREQNQCRGEVVSIIDVGQTLWIAILGGAILDAGGRLTIQNLPGRWGMRGVSADEAYLSRVKAVVDLLKPHARSLAFFDLVYSNGLSRRPALAFLLFGLIAQGLLCFSFATVLPTGVWLSVALTNALFAGHLTDWHSVYFGKTAGTAQPGVKMKVPGSKDELLAIATLDRTPPREGPLRPGLFLNLAGVIGAGLGTVYRRSTLRAMDIPAQPVRPWIVYALAFLTLGTAVLVAGMVAIQQRTEKTWRDDASAPTRWMMWCTLPSAILAGVLSLYSSSLPSDGSNGGGTWGWVLLEVITFASGLPLGALENGRLIAGDENVLQLVLVCRWLMGTLAGALAAGL